MVGKGMRWRGGEGVLGVDRVDGVDEVGMRRMRRFGELRVGL